MVNALSLDLVIAFAAGALVGLVLSVVLVLLLAIWREHRRVSRLGDDEVLGEC